jgi:hypothetical protein
VTLRKGTMQKQFIAAMLDLSAAGKAELAGVNHG